MILISRNLIAVAFLFFAGIAAANTLTVASVHAGGVIEFEGGWETHLAGITVPDRTTPIGYQAFDFTKRLLEGKTVAVFTCTTDNTSAGIVYGEDGLPFAKIVFGTDLETDIAALLLEKGYARVDENCPTENYDAYKDIEREARRQGVGLWTGP
jgi:endonuclease YncB( thermonuclease family)